jgi:hypothetical protein
MQTVLQHSSAWWIANNPVLGLDIEGIETDTKKVKYGDGITAWNDLEYSGFKRNSRHLIVDKENNSPDVLIDCGTITEPSDNVLIDGGSII